MQAARETAANAGDEGNSVEGVEGGRYRRRCRTETTLDSMVVSRCIVLVCGSVSRCGSDSGFELRNLAGGKSRLANALLRVLVQWPHLFCGHSIIVATFLFTLNITRECYGLPFSPQHPSPTATLNSLPTSFRPLTPWTRSVRTHRLRCSRL